MSLHSPSISSRSDSRHARSCGESTSTPSTSKIAPSNGIYLPSDGRWVPTGRDWRRVLEGLHIPGAKLVDLVAHCDPDRTARPLAMDRERKLVPVEPHQHRGALKLHSERHLLNLDWQSGSEAQDPIAKLGARVSA